MIFFALAPGNKNFVKANNEVSFTGFEIKSYCTLRGGENTLRPTIVI